MIEKELMQTEFNIALLRAADLESGGIPEQALALLEHFLERHGSVDTDG